MPLKYYVLINIMEHRVFAPKEWPFDAFEVLLIKKYYGKLSICSKGSKCSIFHNIFKSIEIFT